MLACEMVAMDIVTVRMSSAEIYVPIPLKGYGDIEWDRTKSRLNWTVKGNCAHCAMTESALLF